MKPELDSIAQVEWQWFCTLTFKSEHVAETVKVKMYFSWLRSIADKLSVHFKKVLWVLRMEHGELTGRFHFHALIGGLPEHTWNRSTAFMMMHTWENLGGGIARCYRFNPALDGVGYILKSSETLLAVQSGNFFEVQKFGVADVILSKSIVRALNARREDKGGRRHPAQCKAAQEVRSKRFDGALAGSHNR
jgi:hypothetical protein